MQTYYEVHRVRTCKAIGSKEGYYTWENERKQFSTMQDVKTFLKDEYGTCKRVKSYRDGKDGEAIQSGIIYCYKTEKCSYDDTAKNNQDWVDVSEIKSKKIIV